MPDWPYKRVPSMSSNVRRSYTDQLGSISAYLYQRSGQQGRDNSCKRRVTDQNLTRVIEQYNTMIIERKRLLRTSSENNPAVINMNTGVEAMRRNVETTVNSVLRGLQIAQKDIERQASKFESRISDAPKQEKEFMTISRQQEIKATLYIMLLQKREEMRLRWHRRLIMAVL